MISLFSESEAIILFLILPTDASKVKDEKSVRNHNYPVIYTDWLNRVRHVP